VQRLTFCIPPYSIILKLHVYSGIHATPCMIVQGWITWIYVKLHPPWIHGKRQSFPKQIRRLQYPTVDEVPRYPIFTLCQYLLFTKTKQVKLGLTWGLGDDHGSSSTRLVKRSGICIAPSAVPKIWSIKASDSSGLSFPSILPYPSLQASHAILKVRVYEKQKVWINLESCLERTSLTVSFWFKTDFVLQIWSLW